MRSIAFGVVLLLIPFILIGQELPGVSSFPKSSNSEKMYARWVFAPRLLPYVPIFSRQLDEDDQEIQVEYDRGFIIGGRIEKYFPNSARGFGIEVDFFNRDLNLFREDRFLISENAISLTPFFSLKKRGFEKLNHPFLEFGVRNQYTLSSQIVQSGGVFLQNPSFLKKYRLWGYIGIGSKKDLFNQPSKKVGLSNFSLGIFFPIFNQTSTFKQTNSGFIPGFDLFRKNRTSNFFVSLNFAQYLDIKKNKCGDCYEIPYELLTGNEQQFLPALANWSKPKKWFFGNFYMHIGFQSRLDSVFIDREGLERMILRRNHAISTRLGYSIHFLGNYSKYYNDKGKPFIIKSDKKVRWDLFVSGGLSDRRIVLGQSTRYRLNQIAAEISGGFRIGYTKLGIFLFGGYTRVFPLYEEFLYEDGTTEDFNFSNTRNEYFFLGFSFRNSILIKCNYFFLENLKRKSSLQDNLGLSIGFAI